MNPVELYEPDGSRLSTMIIGSPGSGKSYFVKKSLTSFMSSNKDPMMHVFYICPKMEMEFGEKSVTTLDRLHKHMRKNRIHVFYPDTDHLDIHVDAIIDRVFDIQEANPELKSVVVLDDSQIFLDSSTSTSDSLVFSKVLEGSTSYIVHFRSLLSPIHLKDAHNRYGYDAEPFIPHLREVDYSHAIFDVTKASAKMMQPV